RDFALPEPKPEALRDAPASPEPVRARRLLATLVPLLANAGAAAPDDVAGALLAELLDELSADRVLLLLHADAGGAPSVVGRATNGSVSVPGDGWRDALLRRTIDATDAAPLRAESERLVAAQLRLGERVLGALLVERHPSAPAFDAADRERIAAAAADLPVALEAVRVVRERAEADRTASRAEKMDAVGQLAGGIAHELNNVLTALQASANSVRERAFCDWEMAADADVILQATRRATLLTRQLLAFSRHRHASLAPHDVNDLVLRVEPTVRAVAGDDVDVVLELAPDLPPASTERAAFEQALLALASNARDAMPAGGTLSIVTSLAVADERAVRRGAPRPGPYVCVTVHDTGAGMPPGVLERAFEPFFTTQPGSRSGAGLATVYAFARSSGGYVDIESEVGRGTTVRLCLGEAEPPPARVAVTSTSRVPAATSKYVLVVDDEEMLRKTVQRMLERGGYRVLVAEGATHALELVQQHGDEIAIAILDVLMPGVTGPELGRRFAELGLPTKVLYMSGFAPESALVSGADVDIGSVLEKPFTPTELLDRVRALLAEG
ncbi:MAG TPA: response regulator, partial [Minicystis sp.]|nr:response regulator [Minicystis sp.]